MTDKSPAPPDSFWQSLDELIAGSTIVIERPKGSLHPVYRVKYPLDYGYLAKTRGSDGAAVDVWCGSLSPRTLVGIVNTCDLGKRDVEVKLLLGCTPAECEEIVDFQSSGRQRGLLISRQGDSE